MSFFLSINNISRIGYLETAYANEALSRSMQRLSTGYRINEASDDPAGYAGMVSLESKLRGLKVAQGNVQSGYAMLGVVDGGLGEINDLLMRLREVGLMGANSVQTREERNALQMEANELVAEVYRVIRESRYGDMQLLGPAGGSAGGSSISTFSTPPPKLQNAYVDWISRK